MTHKVIVGTGLAGYILAKEYRKLNKDSRLTLITADDGSFYSKPLLSTALAQGKAPKELAVSSVDAMRKQLNADIHTYSQVTSIDAVKNTLSFTNQFSGHQSLSYDDLVLANGAEKINIPLDGDAVDAIQSVNNLQEYESFRNFLAEKQQVIILGSGLVGCEFANDLLKAGYDVSIVSLDDYPLKALVPEAVGRSLQAVFEAQGVKWHLSQSAKTVSRVSDGFEVTLSSGAVLLGALVFSAVGIKPSTHLAKMAGLTVDQGIVVDNQLRSSVSNIFALGDCAQVDGMLRMYVAPILHGAKVLAKVLNSEVDSVKYPVMPIVIKTTMHPVAVVSPSDACVGQWQFEHVGNNVKAVFIDSAGLLQGFALSGTFTKERLALIKQLGS